MDIKPTETPPVVPNAGGGTWPPDKENKLSTEVDNKPQSGSVQQVLQDDIVTLSDEATKVNQSN